MPSQPPGALLHDPTSDKTRPDEADRPERPPHWPPDLARPSRAGPRSSPTRTTSGGESRSTGPAAATSARPSLSRSTEATAFTPVREDTAVLPGPTEEHDEHETQPGDDDGDPAGNGARHLTVERLRVRASRCHSVAPPRATNRRADDGHRGAAGFGRAQRNPQHQRRDPIADRTRYSKSPAMRPALSRRTACGMCE